MSDFKAKMHQIRFRPRPLWGSLKRSPDRLAGFKGPTCKGRGGGKGEGGAPKHVKTALLILQKNIVRLQNTSVHKKNLVFTLHLAHKSNIKETRLKQIEH